MRLYRTSLLYAIVLLLAACGQATGGQPGADAAKPRPTARGATTAAKTAVPAATKPSSTSLPLIENGGAPLAQVKIATQLVTKSLDQPVYVTGAGDASGRLFVVEKAGRLRIVRNTTVNRTPFLDITDRVGANGSEQGLLSVAFHPRFKENGLLFVDYTNKAGNTVISRFQAKADSADPASEQILLTIDQPYANHNGGLVKFGPDGFLYIGMGDGGSAGDPQNNAQNAQVLLGKMLRIDVDQGSPYAIPAGNPFANGGGRGEIWTIGMRNPWRYSFDRATNDLYIGDVGQNTYEEIDFQAANSGAGANYGWPITEATHCFRDANCDATGTIAPIAEYSHEQGCSVTGGYVYRGSVFATLQGVYLFGDYCTGRIWGLQRQADGSWAQRELLKTSLQISSFGEDDRGEVYVTNLGDNGLYQIMAP